MTAEELAALQPGDIVRHKCSARGLIVTANYGGRVTAVRTYEVTNPDEWDVITSGGRPRLATAFNASNVPPPRPAAAPPPSRPNR
jgi:hypothetical protein